MRQSRKLIMQWWPASLSYVGSYRSTRRQKFAKARGRSVRNPILRTGRVVRVR